MTQISRFLRTPKGWLLVGFLALLGAAGPATGWSSVLPHLGWAIAGAIVVDELSGWAAGEPVGWPSSALLSGMIVAFILGVETPGIVTAAVGAFASATKYVLLTRRGHAFNPAGLALLLAVPVFGAAESWWGALGDLPFAWMILLVIVGALILDKVNKYVMVFGFLGTMYGLFSAVALVRPALVAEMFRAPFVQSALFLAFFMLTDPPTSPGKPSEQLWMGVLAGAVAAVAQLAGAGQVYLLVGLLAVNVVLLIQRVGQDWRRRRARLPVSTLDGGDPLAV